MRFGSEWKLDRELENALAELESVLAAQEQELAQEAEAEAEAEAEGESSCPGPDFETVEGFPRYSNSISALPRSGQDQLQDLAQHIVDSFASGCQPILRVTVVGHADRDLQREARERGFMQRISRERAVAVMNELIRLVGPTIAPQIIWDAHGAGDANLVVENPVTESQRKQNRRVEIEASTDARSCESECERTFQFCLSRASTREQRVKCGQVRRGCLHRCKGVPV